MTTVATVGFIARVDNIRCGPGGGGGAPGRYGVAIATGYGDTCLAGLASLFWDFVRGFFIFGGSVRIETLTVTNNEYYYYYYLG